MDLPFASGESGHRDSFAGRSPITKISEPTTPLEYKDDFG